MKICFVHEYLIDFGGGEQVLKGLLEIWPNSPVFTLIYDENSFGSKKSTHRLARQPQLTKKAAPMASLNRDKGSENCRLPCPLLW